MAGPTVKDMNLLLLSWGIGALPAFLTECVGAANPRIGYVGAAALPYGDASFVRAERARIEEFGQIVDVVDQLPEVDMLYVAGGNTFVLMDTLRRTGLDEQITARVRAGLPYVGLSAGSIITGPSLEPATLMDDRTEAPDLTDLAGLGWIEDVIVPHADGQLPPYPLSLINRTVEQYGNAHRLLRLPDDQALRVDARGSRIVTS